MTEIIPEYLIFYILNKNLNKHVYFRLASTLPPFFYYVYAFFLPVYFPSCFTVKRSPLLLATVQEVTFDYWKLEKRHSVFEHNQVYEVKSDGKVWKIITCLLWVYE